MRAHWHAIHADLVRSSNRLSFQSDFITLRTRQGALQDIPDPAALLERLHAKGGDPAAKNTILQTLVAEARDPGSDTTLILVILALWPGLDAVYGRLWRHFRQEPEWLASEIAARIMQGIRTFDPERAHRVAATLIRNVERDIRRMLHSERATDLRKVELTDAAAVAEAAAPSVFGLVRGLDADRATAILGERLRALIGDDAALVLAIAVQGEMQRAAAIAAGLTYEVARKRYQRALARLRTHLDF